MSGHFVSPAALKIVSLLAGQEPKGIFELAKAAKVTRTAVTEQLSELMAGGYVERTVQRSTSRGRPRHVYKATHAALSSLFPGNQGLLVPLLCRAVCVVCGERKGAQVFKRAGRDMADHYARTITAKKPLERLRQLMALLRDEGALFEIVETSPGRCVVYKRNCPFIGMFDESRTVCCIDQEMMTAVLGCRVRRIEWRHDGAPCCAFEIAIE
jgi:DeoR family transcriptional regulator, suf operon transcriptional repressor